MIKEGIDETEGTVNVYKLCPKPGDSIMVVNCGDHYEVRHHHWEQQAFDLTAEDIEDLRQGRIIWN